MALAKQNIIDSAYPYRYKSMIKASNLYQQYKNFQPFSDDEAWFLFKLAAFAEAIGWSLLILGILCRDVFIPGNQVSVLLAGRIHGTLFLLYIAAVLILAPSLRWSCTQTMIAGLCSVPPYGSLLYEVIVNQSRQSRAARQYYASLHYYLGAQLLATHPTSLG